MYRTTSVFALGLFLGLAPVTAYAQQDTQQLDIDVPENQQQAEQQPDQERSAGLLATEQQSLMVDSMIGADVYSSAEDETVGSIDDVLISVDGEAEGVIIGVGGWLGVGERDVLVSMQDLSLELRDDELRLVLQRTREELESEPEFQRVDERQQTTVQNQVGTMQPGTVQQDGAQDDTAQQDMSEQDMSEQDMAEQDMAEQDTMQREPRDGQIVFQDEDSILASTMIGTDVQVAAGEEDEELGQISDVLITMDGQVEGVVIGVGGFLGLGEKDVVVAMDRLDIQRTEEDEVRVSVLETRESLEAADSFERPQQQSESQQY